ncbi:uncharacterized protein LOC17900352 [Capsella rubella]|uniref:uncharacterized protein LOC17900352 n=1 Tax=Capsella rubella TaxID=81985 RepID=UPI000CD4CBC4|nr:uncharacterized protein LOC17900352 [Capsella rubella]
MQEHRRANLKRNIEYKLGNRIIFAELNTRGRIIQCPNCHVPFRPHLGNWRAEKFPCERCKAHLCFRNGPARRARCLSSNISRPVPNNLVMLVCGGCEAKVIHQRHDKTVKCSDCKHISVTPLGRVYGVRPPTQEPPPANRFLRPQVNLIDSSEVNQVGRAYGVPPANQDPLHVNGVVRPQVNVIVPPRANQDSRQSYWIEPVEVNKDQPRLYRLVPSQLNHGPPQANWLVPPQVNRVVPPQVNQDPQQVYQVGAQQVNRVVPPRVYRRRNRVANAETESTASSSFTPRPEITVIEYPDNAVAEAVRNVAGSKRVVKEEDKTEAAGSKKPRL